MLSILIPVYNYNINPLVREIHKQASACEIIFEIILFDDASDQYSEANSVINELSGCRYKKLEKNIGRSSIRNLLASEAVYEYLLFIDAGTMPLKSDFIKSYIDHIHYPVVSGGMTYSKISPNKPFKLRWLYTKKRESVGLNQKNGSSIICSSNFFIHKEIFSTIQFDESILKYGCEDVLFFDTIIENNIQIRYIQNPVVHDASDDAEVFIKKTEYAIENLIELINTNKLTYNRYTVSSIYYKTHTIGIDKIISFLFKISRNLLKKNLKSSNPFILWYDFYRLGYFCFIKNKT